MDLQQQTLPYPSPTSPMSPTSPTSRKSPNISDAAQNGFASDLGTVDPLDLLPTFIVPINLTQPLVEADAALKRLQQDLLILASLPDNSSLHWRPSWFNKPALHSDLWTLHNPPHVVTEQLPREPMGRQVTTRRLRRSGDAVPVYMKTNADWDRYCVLYGVPHDFLCEDQVRLMRLRLPRDSAGYICEPPAWPVYPEPPTLSQYSYVLNSETYNHLPPKFRKVTDHMPGWAIVVLPDGTLRVEEVKDPALTKFEGPGRRWSYIPWTEEQAESCQTIKMKLVFWNTALDEKDKKAKASEKIGR